MEFPRSLAPWAHLLKVFPRELSLALGPAVQRLAAAIGPLQSVTTTATGDPDGFDDLTRRGSYERLLASEWLLADELPDEFARRAAMGEHLFLRVARRSPSASRVSLALFDAGPNQLGGPRIAHLAAWIVFTRRAEAAGTRFEWGVLQRPEAPVLSGFNTAEIMRLLAARSVDEVRQNQVDAWMARTADWRELDDLWLVGGERLGGLAPARASRVAVRDSIEIGARRLALTVRGATNSAKTLTLELPDENACARLLRDPFDALPLGPPLSVQGAFRPLSNLIFDAGGIKLFARSLRDRVIAYPVPNSPHGRPGDPRLYRMHRGTPVTAAGRIGKAVCLITSDGAVASVEYNGKQGISPPAGRYRLINQKLTFQPPDSSQPLQGCFRLSRSEGAPSDIVFIDGGQSLFQLGNVGCHRDEGRDGIAGSAHLCATSVQAVAAHYGRVLYVGQQAPGARWVIESLGEKTDTCPLPFDTPPRSAFFGFGGASAHPTYGMVALQENELRWVIVNRADTLVLNTAPGDRVVGAFGGTHGIIPSLLVLSNDGRSLVLVSNGGRRDLLTEPSVIEHVAVSTAGPNLAYSTTQGDVVIYSFAHQKPLCRFTPREVV